MSLLRAASIGRMLARDAIWCEDACTWLGRRPPSRIARPAYTALGPDLFGGTAGIAWFLAELSAATREARIRTAALGAIRHALDEAPRIPRARIASFFAGAPGIALAAALVAERTADEETLRRAARLAEAATGYVGAGNDLVFGAAGRIVAFDALAHILDGRALLERAISLGDDLLRRGERAEGGLTWRAGTRGASNLAGMAHGASGVAVALLTLFAATGTLRYRDAAEAAFAWERTLYDPRRRNWPDLTDVRRGRMPRHPPFVSWWCHGAPGIALARIRGTELRAATRWREEAVIAVQSTRSALDAHLGVGTAGPELCHGLAGNAAVLLEGLPFLPGRDRADARRTIAAAARAAYRLVARDPLDAPALFTGAAGVGWLNLRISGAQGPSPLLLRREELPLPPGRSAFRSYPASRRA